MKRKEIASKVFKSWALFLLLGLVAVQLTAQTEKSRTVEKSFTGKTAIWAAHRYGDLIMKKGSGNQIKAILKIKATGKDASETEKFLNEFDLNASEVADNKVDIKTNTQIQSWNSINSRTTIIFKNGNTYKNIKDFEMTLELYVPKLRYATLENRYKAIKVEEGTTNILIINLYDGEIDAPGTFEKLNLEMKYSEGKVGNFNTSESKLYDSNIEMGDGQSLTMESKYSEVQVGTLNQLTLDTYDDDFRIRAITGATKIKDKYSEFRFGNIADVELELYDAMFEVQNAGNVMITNSKYTEFEFENIKNMDITSSYDDAFKIAKVTNLAINESKYTEYNIGMLEKSLHIKSYDDALDIRSVSSGFESFTFEGKYTEIDLPIPASVKYQIDANTKYGKIDFPENELDMGIYKEKNSEVTLQGKLKGAGSDAPKIVINAYDCAIKLK